MFASKYCWSYCNFWTWIANVQWKLTALNSSAFETARELVGEIKYAYDWWVIAPLLWVWGITGNTWNRSLRKMLVSDVHIFLNIFELRSIWFCQERQITTYKYIYKHNNLNWKYVCLMHRMWFVIIELCLFFIQSFKTISNTTWGMGFLMWSPLIYM